VSIKLSGDNVLYYNIAGSVFPNRDRTDARYLASVDARRTHPTSTHRVTGGSGNGHLAVYPFTLAFR